MHVRRISNVLPVLHSTATLKALDNPAIANFLAGKAERELKKLRDWEKLQVSEIQPFLDAKINIREIKALNKSGNELTVFALAHINDEITGDKLFAIYKGYQYPLTLSKGGETKAEYVPEIQPPSKIKDEAKISVIFNGKPNGVGHAMAKAIPLDRPNVSLIKPENIAPDIIEEEIQKFTKAYDDEVKILEENKKKFAADRQASSIFFVPIQVLAGINALIVDSIRKDQCNTVMAVNKVMDEAIKGLQAHADNESEAPLLRMQKRDLISQLKYIKEGIIKHRYGIKDNILQTLQHSDEDVIVVSSELSPNDAAHFAGNEKVKGVVLGKGTRTDHTVIILKNAGIPTVHDVGDVSAFKSGQFVIVDGVLGRSVADPDETMMAEYRDKQREFSDMKKFLEDADRRGVTRTTDGRRDTFIGECR